MKRCFLDFFLPALPNSIQTAPPSSKSVLSLSLSNKVELLVCQWQLWFLKS